MNKLLILILFRVFAHTTINIVHVETSQEKEITGHGTTEGYNNVAGGSNSSHGTMLRMLGMVVTMAMVLWRAEIMFRILGLAVTIAKVRQRAVIRIRMAVTCMGMTKDKKVAETMSRIMGLTGTYIMVLGMVVKDPNKIMLLQKIWLKRKMRLQQNHISKLFKRFLTRRERCQGGMAYIEIWKFIIYKT